MNDDTSTDDFSTTQALQDRLNPHVPHSARVWNYLLGGKDNFPADRAAADEVVRHFPEIIQFARAGRAFLGRAVQHLVKEAGIRQLLDLGTGLPTADNTHQIAQRSAPESKIVYVDNDPLVLVHARALLTSHPDGATAYIEADVRESGRILREARETLDFDQPVAVMMLGILGQVPDDEQASEIVARFMAAMPSGSYLVINDSVETPESSAAIKVARDNGSSGYRLRTVDQIAAFFTGLELVAPGVGPTNLWRRDPQGEQPLDVYCGVARKP